MEALTKQGVRQSQARIGEKPLADACAAWADVEATHPC